MTLQTLLECKTMKYKIYFYFLGKYEQQRISTKKIMTIDGIMFTGRHIKTVTAQE